MHPLVAGQTAVVTGGANGIGRAIALALAEHGSDVVVADLTPDPDDGSRPTHERIAADEDVDATFVACDVASVPDIKQAVAEADRFGGINIMVNNAAVYETTDVFEVSVAEFDRLQAVNARGAFFGSQIAARRMRAAGESGSIINVSSTAGMTGGGRHVTYSASKGAVHALTTAFADAVGPSGIRVNCIVPGATDTGIRDDVAIDELDEDPRESAEAATPLGRIGTPADVAGVALFLASDLSSHVTAESIIVDGGLTNTG